MVISRILALGGGGFSMEPENLALDRYALSLTAKETPRVLFLQPGESEEYIARFYQAFRTLPCSPAHFTLFHPSTADIRGLLLSMDLIYVGGGNTRSMLALWREWNLPQYLREAWQQGVVLTGVSAGSI